jgi:hypothetical protein
MAGAIASCPRPQPGRASPAPSPQCCAAGFTSDAGVRWQESLTLRCIGHDGAQTSHVERTVRVIGATGTATAKTTASAAPRHPRQNTRVV